jgi:hypothetical protein
MSEKETFTFDFSQLTDEEIAAIPNVKLREFLQALRRRVDEFASAGGTEYSRAFVQAGWDRAAEAAK